MIIIIISNNITINDNNNADSNSNYDNVIGNYVNMYWGVKMGKRDCSHDCTVVRFTGIDVTNLSEQCG